MEWQPIETHPTSGKVLLYNKVWFEKGLLPIGSWEWVNGPLDDWDSFCLWAVDEDFSVMGDGWLWPVEDLQPTHWLPLPEKPFSVLDLA